MVATSCFPEAFRPFTTFSHFHVTSHFYSFFLEQNYDDDDDFNLV